MKPPCFPKRFGHLKLAIDFYSQGKKYMFVLTQFVYVSILMRVFYTVILTAHN
ncbi:MAG: hypothetical protein ACI8RD_013234 [Bacillariaceae sp.]|jgi:hypothetical protein